MPAPGRDIVAEAVLGIVVAAEQIRGSGRLAPHYEADLSAKFDALALDVDGLERAVAAGALSEPQRYLPSSRTSGAELAHSSRGAPTGVRAIVQGATRRSRQVAAEVSRRGSTKFRQMAGPHLRELERTGVDRLGRMSEVVATRVQVVADHSRRVATSGGSSRRLDRVTPAGRARPSLAPIPRERYGSTLIGAPDPDTATSLLVDWIVDRIGRGPGGRMLHVECNEGGLVDRLLALGYDALGGDPMASPSERRVRAGALECLGVTKRSSLGALVVSGVTDDVTPASARALAHLARTRLEPGGIVVVVSTHPRAAGEEDPVTADLNLRRALHPVTWCHLLARYGFVAITVYDPSGSASQAARTSWSSPGGATTQAGQQGRPEIYAVSAQRTS